MAATGVAPLPRELDADGTDSTDSTDSTAMRHERSRALHELCERWAAWRRSRRLFGGPVPRMASTLGRLTTKRRAVAPLGGGPDAECSAEIVAFHRAYLAQPDGIDKSVFDLHYWHRVKPISAVARKLGLTRAAWYARLARFRERVASMAAARLADDARDRDQIDCELADSRDCESAA